jgi:hypothetical protein
MTAYGSLDPIKEIFILTDHCPIVDTTPRAALKGWVIGLQSPFVCKILFI